VAVGALLTAGLALFVSPWASSQPDGLQRVALDEGFAETAEAHAVRGLPTAGYEVRGVSDDGLSAGLAGLLGVAVTFVVAGGATVALRRSARPVAAPPPAAQTGA
jgi:hypothetical protein